jgi:hypothetical protein
MAAETNLDLSDRCLAVFVDDTGHEALIPGQPDGRQHCSPSSVSA